MILYFIVNSCAARLKVKVSAADRDEIVAKVEDGLKKELPTIIENLNYLITKGDAINDEYYKFLKENIEGYEKEISVYEKQYDDIKSTISIASTLYSKNEYLPAFQQSKVAEQELITFFNSVNNFLDSDVVESKTAINNSKKVKTDINSEVGIIKNDVIKNESKTNQLRFHLLGDPLTSFVTKNSNKEIWKSTYNQTKVSTFMGDTDIAVLLRKNPDEGSNKSGDYNNNFTIKGVRLDAEDVIEASFKTLSQSINLFASIQMAGTNLTSSDQATEYPSLSSELNTSLNNLISNKNKLKKKEKYLKELRKLLIEKIIFEDAENKADGNLNSSIKEIKEFWNNVKSELESLDKK